MITLWDSMYNILGVLLIVFIIIIVYKCFKVSTHGQGGVPRDL